MNYAATGVNFLICMGIVCICICRLDKIDRTILRRVGAQYVLLVVSATAFGLQPYFGGSPNWIDVVFSGTLLHMLMADGYQWRHGRAPESATIPAELHQ